MLSKERLRAFLAQDPGNPELACQLCDAYIADAELSDAVEVLSALPPSARELPAVSFRISRIDLLFGRYAEAARRLSELVRVAASPATYHDLAFAQLCLHDLDSASASLAEAEAQFAPSADHAILAARIALMRRDYAAADEALGGALELEPGHPTVLGLQALSALDAGDTARAQSLAEACLRQAPQQHEALLAAGAIGLYQQDVEVASLHFGAALERYPNSGRALSGMGQAWMLRGDPAAAEPLLQHATQVMPDHIGTWHALGWLQLLGGRREQAEHSYRQALALDRNFAESHGGVAVTALLAGRTDEGHSHLERSLRLDPNCISGRYAQVLWLEAQGQQQAADTAFAALAQQGLMAGVADATLSATELARRLKARLTAVVPR
ncbi:MAG TPA: tetratricopeptide repeat protein [Stenotrophomonas sp.]|nr:tetratricopeptide repeat protein [Stenotrophomonas sp.]